jgi:hypothetical protein
VPCHQRGQIENEKFPIVQFPIKVSGGRIARRAPGGSRSYKLLRMRLAIIAFLVFLINLPFGYWRAGAAKFSRQWFLAIHLPVPIVIALRIVSELGFQLVTFPVMIGAFFLGQYGGGMLRLKRG